MTVQLTTLVPQDCQGCGLCCEGIGSPVAIYTYRTSHSGPYLFRPRDLPRHLADEIDRYFDGLKAGEKPVDNCLWFDETTRQCKHHEWRPQVCRKYDVGCDLCLKERAPFVVTLTTG
jgi:Fe-S-cluster containining protein